MEKEVKREFTGVWIPHELIKTYGFKEAMCIAALWFEAPLENKDAIIRRLKTKKVLFNGRYSPEDIKSRLENKAVAGLGIGSAVCEWCRIRTYTLHQHHYPTPRRNGGTQIVNICPNCHQEFHSFETKHNFVFAQDIAKQFEGAGQWNK